MTYEESELKLEIDALKYKIEVLEQKLEEESDLEGAKDDGYHEGFNDAGIDKEDAIEKAFYSGHKSGVKKEPSLVAYLNYKLEARL